MAKKRSAQEIEEWRLERSRGVRDAFVELLEEEATEETWYGRHAAATAARRLRQLDPSDPRLSIIGEYGHIDWKPEIEQYGLHLHSVLSEDSKVLVLNRCASKVEDGTISADDLLTLLLLDALACALGREYP